MLLSKRMHEKGAAFCAAAIPFGGTLGSHRSDARGSCMTPWIFSQKHDQQLPARRIADNLLSVLLLAVEGGSLWTEHRGMCFRICVDRAAVVSRFSAAAPPELSLGPTAV